jgi:hypothetical protein
MRPFGAVLFSSCHVSTAKGKMSNVSTWVLGQFYIPTAKPVTVQKFCQERLLARILEDFSITPAMREVLFAERRNIFRRPDIDRSNTSQGAWLRLPYGVKQPWKLGVRAVPDPGNVLTQKCFSIYPFVWLLKVTHLM